MSGFKVSFSGNKKIDVEFKNFKVKTDQSKKNEGEESAPDPFSIFIASLGACAGFYANTFCDIRKLSTEHMHLFVEVVFKKGQKLIQSFWVAGIVWYSLNKSFMHKRAFV